MLKAIFLESVPESQHDSIEVLFRGQSGHDLKLLMRELKRRSGRAVPTDIGRTLTRLNTWTPNLRYFAGTIKRKLADEFVRDAAQVMKWIDERI
jgi:hypothetical protein